MYGMGAMVIGTIIVMFIQALIYVSDNMGSVQALLVVVAMLAVVVAAIVTAFECAE